MNDFVFTLDLIQGIKYNSLNKNIKLGPVFKYARLKKNLTMEELCDGICCPAYESKLERNQYEYLNDTIIPKLCERLDLSYEDVKCACNEDELIEAIHEYFTSDVEKLSN